MIHLVLSSVALLVSVVSLSVTIWLRRKSRLLAIDCERRARIAVERARR